MSTVPSGTRFIGISENVNLAERKSSVLNAETQPYTIQDIADTVGAGAQGPQGVQGPPGPPGTVSPAGLEWRGAWVSGTSYVADDAVGYDGASWFCILATSGTTAPDLATANWALLASQGAQGIQGVQGPTGPQGPAGSDTVTLQQVLDNNHDLVDGNFFAGTNAGDNNTGNTVIAIGESAASSNSGIIVNALGEQAAGSNSGTEINAFGPLAAFLNEGNYVNGLGANAATGNLADYVNAFGSGAGSDNTFNHVQLLGKDALADEDGQTVLSKDGTIMARISTTDLTATRKYTLQDGDGTLALTSDITTPTLQEVTDNGGNTTTNSITLTSDTVPVNIGYGAASALDVLTFTDNGVDVSLGFAGLSFTTAAESSGLNTTSVEFNQDNKQTYYGGPRIIFRDSATAKDLNIDYPTSIVGTNKIQTFQDASGTIALTSQLPTVAGNYVSDLLAAAGGVPVGGMYHTAGVVKIRLT